ncbi:MAG: ribose-phosphate diphosphokinase [Acidimicrobiaceae bacterium]|nr:ribose-phosphate diphosphokinase [Acidimicrobiaceae bacterium]
MELVPRKRLEIYTGRSHPGLVKEIANHLDIELGDVLLREFSDGEIHCRYGESVRGKDIFVVQSHAKPVNDSIVEQLIMIDAAKRASAKRITAVCPYFGYSRQDRKATGREPITAKLVMDMLQAAGADRVITVDLHSGQIQGFFNGPVDHLTAMPVLVDYLRPYKGTDLVVIAPDAGRVKVAQRFSQQLNLDLGFVHKRRPRGTMNKVEALEVVTEVDLRGRRCVIIDDLIDTAGTICAASELLKKKGCSEVWAMATHAVLSGKAKDNLMASSISKLVVTDTLPIPTEKLFPKLEILSIARIIAQAIGAVFEDTSVSDIFQGDNLM